MNRKLVASFVLLDLKYRASSITPAVPEALSSAPGVVDSLRLSKTRIEETDPDKQKAIAETVQLHVLNYPTHVPLGQFTTPTALRKNVTGLLTAPAMALWNIEKK